MDSDSGRRDASEAYDAVKAALEKGFVRADQVVYDFSMDNDLSPEQGWRLMADEAARRGDDAVRYLAEHPLDERSYQRRNVHRQAGRAARSGMDQLAGWLESRRGRR